MANAQERALAKLAMQRGHLTPGGLGRAQTGRAQGESLPAALERLGLVSTEALHTLVRELNRPWPACKGCGRSVPWSELASQDLLSCPGCGLTLELPGDPQEGSQTQSGGPRRPPYASATPMDHSASSGLGPSQVGPGQRLGDYELDREVGRGSNGVVYLARRPGIQRYFALKVLLDADQADEETVARFQLEAAVASKLTHPGIVAVHDVGWHGGHLYYAMDYVKGETLKERLREGPLDPVETAVLMGRLARTLQVAHEAGVIHRDVKPANIVLAEDTGRPKVMDFGLARDRSLLQSMTQSGDVIGTPFYMAPEQFRGQRDLDHRADIYALGVILYEALCGQRPYSATSALELSQKVIRGDPPPPSSVLEPSRGRVSPGLERICLRAMAVDPDDRFPTAADMREALEQVLRVELDPATRGRGRLVPIALTVMGLVVLGLGVFVGAQPRPDDPPPPGPSTSAGDLSPLAQAKASLRRLSGTERASAPYPEVEALLEEAVASSSGKARGEALLALTEFLVRRGRFEAAVERLEAMTSDDPTLTAAWSVWRGRAEEALGHDELARRAWSRAIELDPGGVWGAVAEANLARAEGRTDDAVTAAEAALARGPDNPSAWLELGRGLLRRGEPGRDEALTAFERLKELAPDEPEAELGLASLRLAEGKPSSAERNLERAIDLTAPYPVAAALVVRARLLRLKGEAAPALTECEQALRIHPEHLEALVLQALIRLDLEDREAAEESWRKALGLDAAKAERLAEGEGREAKRRLTDLVRVEEPSDPASAAAANLPLGRLTSRLRKSLEERSKVVERDSVRALLFEALSAAATGKAWSLVQSALLRAGTQAPDSAALRLEQVEIYVGRGRLEEAADLIEDSRKRGWRSPALDRLAADTAWRAGDLGRAVLSYRSLASSPGVEGPCAGAYLAFLEGDEAAALQRANEALKLDPGHGPSLVIKALALTTRGKGEDAARAAYEAQGLIDPRLLVANRLNTTFAVSTTDQASALSGVMSLLGSAAFETTLNQDHLEQLQYDLILRSSGEMADMMRSLTQPGPATHGYNLSLEARRLTAAGSAKAVDAWIRALEASPGLQEVPRAYADELRRARPRDPRVAQLLGE